MEKYVRPEMEIDFVENCEILTASSCDCTMNFAYGEGEDPWGGDPFDD